MNQSRQPKGIPVGGQFAASARGESAVSLVDVPDLDQSDYSTWEPSEVDAELARLYEEHGTAMSRYSSYYSHAIDEVARRVYNRGWRGKCSRDEYETAIAEARARIQDGTADHGDRDIVRRNDDAVACRDKAEAIAEQMVPFNEEFDARGGWTRAFLVSNTNGHVHKDMNCSSCFRPGYDNSGNWRAGTRYHWVTEMSGKTEEEVVDAAGERACTVCYPSAPVSTLNKPTTLFTPDEVQKAKDREAREQAKIERQAKKIANGLTADGSEFEVDYVSYGRPGREFFKTERAASQWVVQYWAWHRDEPERLAGYQPAFDAVMQAVATKHGKSIDEVRAEFEKKMVAKRKRDGYTD